MSLIGYVRAFSAVVLCLGGLSHLSAQTNGQIVSSGYSIPVPVGVAARGQIITLFVNGLNVPDAAATSIPLPTTLSGVTVRVTSQIPNYPVALPIFSVVTQDFCLGSIPTSCPFTQITVEIPTEPTCVRDGSPGSCDNPAAFITLSVDMGSTVGPSFVFSLAESLPHIVNGCDTTFGTNQGGICYSLVTHADGTFVGDAGYPNGPYASPGETITFYAVGLGVTTPIVPTGQAAQSGTPATIPVISLPLIVSYRSSVAAETPLSPVTWIPIDRFIFPSYIGLVPGNVGLYQVNVTLPSELAQAPGLSGGCPLMTKIAVGAGGFGTTDGLGSATFCVQP